MGCPDAQRLALRSRGPVAQLAGSSQGALVKVRCTSGLGQGPARGGAVAGKT